MWIAIFDAVGKGTFDDKEGVTQFILEEKTGSVNQKGPVKNPFTRPRFGLNAFDADTLNADKLNKQHWATVKDNFQTAGVRLLNMEGDIGKPPAIRPTSTLWEGVQSLDGNVSAISTYIKGDLANDLVLVTKMAEVSSAVARKTKLGVEISMY